MNKKAFTAVALFLVMLISLTAGAQVNLAKAQSPKTIVVPDDYITINAAIGNATSGDTILIRSGTYLESSLLITKSITLIGENAANTIIVDTDKPTPYLTTGQYVAPNVITFSADNVVIADLTLTISDNTATYGGFSIAGGGTGTRITGNNLPDRIQLTRGSNQTILQNKVAMIWIRAQSTFVVGNTVGSVLVENGVNNIIYGNTMANSDNQSLIYLSSSDHNTVVKNKLTGSSYGVYLLSSSENTISGNTISNNNVGIWAIGRDNIFYGNDISRNIYGAAASGSGNIFYNNNFWDNPQIENPDLYATNLGTTVWYSGAQGNYWSAYKGSDGDGDGVGDSPYTINQDNVDPYPLMSPFSISSVTFNLPSWADPSSVTPPQTFPPKTFPSPTVSPTPTQTSSTTPSATPTNAPTQTPSLTVTPTPNPSPAIPEFPAWLPLPVALSALATATAICKKSRVKKVRPTNL